MIGKIVKLTRWLILRSSSDGLGSGEIISCEIIIADQNILLLSEITTVGGLSNVKVLKGNTVGYIFWHSCGLIPFEYQ